MNLKLDLFIWHETLKTIMCGQEAEISEVGIKDEIEELKNVNKLNKKAKASA